MPNLKAIDFIDKAFYYQTKCPYCGDTFVYKSLNGLLRQLWDWEKFKEDYLKHLRNEHEIIGIIGISYKKIRGENETKTNDQL